MERSDISKLIIAITLTAGLGLLGGIFTFSEIANWYAGLHKPSFNPPNWLFGPVWTVLYILMGISVWIVWKQPASPGKKSALAVFITQFVLNFCWSLIFFKLHQTGWAFVEICILWVFILFTIIQFGKFSAWAAGLLVPYLAWVSFASLLTLMIWRLN
jgi:benzodiazapine receptor